MGDKNLPVKTQEQKLNHVNETFKITNTINQLHAMMKEVTKEEINPRTVNAACNCVQQLNNTIDMTIKAARYLGEK